jgi:hypothetical protein
MSGKKAVTTGSFATTRHSALRRAALGVSVLGALATFSAVAGAQTPFDSRSFEVRPVTGAFVPTGDLRDELKDAVLVGAGLSYAFTRNVALVGNLGWSPTRDKLRGDEKLEAFQYDLGIEGRLNNLTPNSSLVTRPYVALGAGGRTYRYRDLANTDNETNFLGYGAVGLDLAPRSGPVGVRLEVRDNLSAFKGFQGELPERKARNDVQFSAGLTFAF